MAFPPLAANIGCEDRTPRRRACRGFRAALGLAVALLAAMPAQADDVADFYKGKRVNLIVSYGPGGGYDVYARVLARHIGQAHPRQSEHRGAEHAGRGLAARRQLPLQRRAQGRHHVRHLRTQHGDARPAQDRPERPVRSDEIHLARLVVEPRQRRLCADPAPRRQGEDRSRTRAAPAVRRSSSAAPRRAPRATPWASCCASGSASTSR